MKRISISVSSSVFAVLGMVALAGAGEPLPRAVVPVGGDGVYSYYGSEVSTYEESLLQGEAALRRATGEQALYTAEALRSYEAAVDQALDNKVKALAVRQQRELMARTHRAELKRLKLQRQRESRALHQQAQEQAEAAMTPAETAARRERLAAGKLELARRLQQQGHRKAAHEWMEKIVQEFPGTKAAREVSLMIAGR